MAEKKEAKRAHKATYAKDKKKGGYLVRVVGPNATEFAGRFVPVTRMDNSENEEHLDRLIWAGTDNGFEDRPGTGLPCALYSFKAKPKEEKEITF